MHQLVDSEQPADGRLAVQYKEPKRRKFLAWFLTVTGVVVLISGAVVKSLGAAIAGGLCFVPGAYASMVYWQLARGSTAYRLQDWYEAHWEGEEPGS